MKKTESRLELIKEYDEELYNAYINNSSPEYIETIEDCYYRERLTKLSVIANLIFLAIISVFIVGIATMNSKYNSLIANFNNLNSQYTMINDKCDELSSEIDLIIGECVEEENNEEPTNLVVPKEVEEVKKEINLCDITTPSNLTAEQLNEIIAIRLSTINQSGTKIENIGESLVRMEEEYGVNALLCLAIGSLESGHGTSSAAINKNNLFGLMGSNGLMKFNSVDECIAYWGKLIREKYMDNGRTSIESIQQKYCPSSTSWSNSIRYLMDEYASYVKI